MSYQFLPAKVGGQKGIAFFNKYFSKHVKLVCVTTRNNDASFAEGYEVLPILSTSPLRYINVFYFFTIRNILRKYQATHLLIEHPYYGWLGWMLKTFYGVKLVVHSHNIEGLRWKTLGKWWWKILWSYERSTHRHADYNFFIHKDDLEYAVKHFGLDRNKCIVMTYGIEWSEKPPTERVKRAKSEVRRKHQIGEDERILLFNGAFDYMPNRDALRVLIEIVNPILMKKEGFNYRLIICGRGIPEEFLARPYPNIAMAGFAEDIDEYFMAADVFLNPVVEGGGIKTKLVEALGNNCNVVSTTNGAIGVDPALCNSKLFIVPDNDWDLFAEKAIIASNMMADVSDAYYKHFYWGDSTRKAAEFIKIHNA